jgi:hypothetical protein
LILILDPFLFTPRLEKWSNRLSKLSKNFDHQIEGLEKIDWSNKPIFLAHHSFATIDLFFFVNEIYRRENILIRGLVDKWFFDLKLLAPWAKDLGMVCGTRQNGSALLEQGWSILIAPGGIREATRSFLVDQNRVIWSHARGFLNLISESQRPVHLVACPRSEELIRVLRFSFSKTLISAFHIPFVLPYKINRVPLKHIVSDPYEPLKKQANQKEKLTYLLQLRNQLEQMCQLHEVDESRSKK